jgi:hypothetical protein
MLIQYHISNPPVSSNILSDRLFAQTHKEDHFVHSEDSLGCIDALQN